MAAIKLSSRKPRHPAVAPVARYGTRPMICHHVSVVVLALGGVLGCLEGAALAAPPLPKGTVPVQWSGGTWSTDSAASLTNTATATGVNQVIKQQANAAVYNWNSFNIANGSSVYFNMAQGSGASALNRVMGNTSISYIQGALGSNGQVYLINQNGIIFDQGAQVNVGGLVASALNINTTDFLSGLQSINTTAPTFFFDTTAPNSGLGAATVTVNNGASISAPSGRVFLFGNQVTNAGFISASDGQVGLAAGQQIYLSIPTVANLRGLLIDVTTAGAPVPTTGNSVVTNTTTGDIETARGNTTLAGYFVNQMGRVSATTSATENGSIYLQARDSVNAQQLPGGIADTSPNLAPNTLVKVAGRGGQLILGPGSVTQILPDSNGVTTDYNNTFYASSVQLSGQLIDMQPGSAIVATGGTVTAAALTRFDPVNQITGTGNKDGTLNWSDLVLNGGTTAVAQDNARFVMETGSSIDVSGSQNVVIPLSRNIVTTALLGASDLENAPLQRDGILYRQKITFDIRDPVPILGDTSAYVNAIQRGAAEMLSTGGSIKLLSSGDMALAQGSTLSIAGGSLAYQGGYANTTKLLSGGKVYDISTAPAGLVYDSIYGTYTVTSPKFGSEATQTWTIPTQGTYEAGYVQGANAGSITMLSRSISTNATIAAGVTDGPQQRSAATTPLGGTLTIGYASDPAAVGNSSYQSDYLAPNILIAGQGTNLPDSFWANPAGAAPGSVGNQVVLSAPTLSDSGLANLALYTNGSLTQDAGASLKLAPGGSLTAIASSVSLGGNIQVQSGKVSITTTITASNVTEGDINVAGTIDTSGGWINDSPMLVGTNPPTTPILVNGGNISLQGNGIDIQSSATLDVSGGAQLTTSGALNLGNAGRIVLASGGTSIDANGKVTQPSGNWLGGALQLDGQLLGAAPGTGGSLALGMIAPVQIGGIAPAGTMGFDTGFFGSGGFRDYTIATVGALTITAGTQLAPVAENLSFTGNYRSAATGSAMGSFATLGTLPAAERAPVNLSLQAVDETSGVVTVQTGAAIRTDPGASVSLVAGWQLTVDGSVSAPAGTINLILRPAQSVTGATDALLDRSVWLGSQSVLATAGVFVPAVANAGLSEGKVLAGGTISIDLTQGGTNGNLATGMLVAQQGSVLDVRGASATLDLPVAGRGVQPTLVGSSGGAINIKTFDGGLLDATLLGAGGTPSAAGGQFNASIAGISAYSGSVNTNITSHLPSGKQSVVLSDGSAPLVPMGAQPGGIIDRSIYGGQLRLRTDTLNAGGFADISLSGESTIQASGTLTLKAASSITLNSPVVNVAAGATFGVSAPYVLITNTGADAASLPSATGGTGSLAVNASLIDLQGNVSLTGVGSTSLNSTGDIRFELFSTGTNSFSGSFNSAGNITLTSAQAYATTGFAGEVDPANPLPWNFNLNAPGQTITFASDGAAAPTPLSAGGSLLVTADNIVQGGVLRAPLGQISLVATNNLTLAPGSLTSVSANGLLIPYGTTVNGTDWTYEGQQSAVAGAGGLAVPTKSVILNGANVTLASQAKIDVSGGGDLYAYEFVPGTGGLTDVLANSNAYAIVPSLGKTYAPYDPAYIASSQSANTASNLKVGETITLGAGSGLPAGTYTLLPARYALLPGAYLVQAVSGYQNILPGASVTHPDGSVTVSGYLGTLNNSSHDALTSGWLVESSAIVRTQAQYNNSYGSSFFANLAASNGTAAPRDGNDAGIIAINAAQSLVLDADLMLSGAAGGRGAAVDIASSKIAVTDGTTGLAASYQSNGYVVLNTSTLDAAGIESLMLGGTRTGSGLPVATDVVVDSPNLALTGGDIILTASNSVTVKDNSAILVSPLAQADTIQVSGAGALLRVAGNDAATVTRTGATTGSAALTIGANVRLGAASTGGHATVVLDSTNANTVDASATINASTASISAASISAGAVPAGAAGLTLGSGLLAQLGQAQNLTLKSYSSIDFYGTTTLGSAGLANLTLDTYALAGRGASPTVNIDAGQVTLTNSSGASSLSTAAQPLGSGSLNIQATNDLISGAGVKTLQGFATVNLTAGQEFSLQNQGSSGVASLAASGATPTAATALTITSGRISGTTGANQSISTTGHLEIDNNPAAPALNAPTGLGATLALSGNDVRIAGTIALPAGSISVSATGGVTGDNLLVAGGAALQANGTATTFDGLSTYTPAGSVTLNAAGGNVLIGANAQVNVSGAAGGGNAGVFTATALNGTVQMSGNADLLGNAAAGYTSGTAIVTAKTLSRLNAINVALNRGGYAEERDFRALTGGLTVGSGSSFAINARNVSLEADGENGIGGYIAVDGTVGGAYAQGGALRLTSASGVGLTGYGQLLAESTGAGNAGGTVYVSTTSATAGNLGLGGLGVNVSGGAGATGGTVWLRAPQTSDSNGNAMGALARISAPVVGASDIVLEGVKTYSYAGNVNIASGASSTATTLALGTGSNPAVGTILGDAKVFMSNAGAIASRVGGGDLALDVRAGTEVDAVGNINVTSALNFFPATATTARPEVVGGALTLRAGGNLNISASISDGFNGTAATSALQVGDMQGQSSVPTWSYRLIGGADLAAADTRQTILNAGSVIIGSTGSTPSDVIVRSATGSIEIEAGGNVQLLNPQAVVYTTGAGTSLNASTQSFSSINSTVLGPSANPFTSDGGSILIEAQGNVVGAPNDNQLVSDWLFRRQNSNSSNPQTAWWSRYDLFREGVATFGGGNVTVRAGGNITDFSASVATNARLPANPATGTQGSLVLQGGGSLNIQAGGNIAGGVYYEGNGTATLVAGDAITVGTPKSNGVSYNPFLALQDGVFNVTAANDLSISTIFNPTIAQNAKLNSSQTSPGAFSSYSDNAAVNLSSIEGDVNVGNVPLATFFTGARTGSGSGNAGAALGTSDSGIVVDPGTLNVVAFSGNVTAAANMVPSPQGNLNLLAQGSLNVIGVFMMDRPASGLDSLPSISNPTAPGSGVGAYASVIQAPDDQGYGLTHLGDGTRARLVALTGDVNVSNSFIGKSTDVAAGLDIVNLDLTVENVNPTDVSTISAGRDFIYTSAINPNSPPALNIDGPGQVIVQAGRNINLGTSNGIVTRGNTVNPLLSSQGASLTVMAGVSGTPDYAALAAKYLSSYGSYAAVYLALGDAQIGNYMAEITAFMRQQPGGAGLDQWAALNQFLALPSATQAQLLNSLSTQDRFLATLPAFTQFLAGYDAAPATVSAAAVSQVQALPAVQQQPFLQRVLFAELGTASDAASAATTQADKSTAYQRGYAAIATLFPGSSYSGDLLMYSSQLKTQGGGDISIFVPGGMVNAGLVVPDSSVSKPASDLGVLTVAGGDINVLVNNDFLVNESRVFTLAGGGILMWSSQGSLDAGRGAKTATSAPAPVVRLDSSGNVIVDYSGSVSGSGIGTIITNKAIPPGDVILAAPNGSINAGDAGIQSAGNFTAASPVFHGADNLQVGGATSGVPTQSSQSAPPPPPNNISNDVKNTVDQITQNVINNGNGGGDSVTNNVFIGFGE